MLSLYLKRVISKNTLRYIFVIFSLLAALSARSADRTFSREFIGTDLTRGRTPLCALRDSYGFLWVGTHSGLSCYDGNLNSVYEATGGVVRSTEGMSVGALFAMGDDILFGGNPGLCVFSRAENTSRPFPLRTRYGVPVSSPVQKIIDGGDGNVWIFTRGQGFFIFDTNDSTLVQNSRHGAFFNDAIRGADGRVYATDINGCLNIFASNGHFISSVTLPDYKADKNPIALTQAGKEIWVSSNNKIYSYNPSTGSISLAVARESGSEINSMATSIHGNVLIGANDGIWLFDVANHATSHLDFTDTGNGAAESDTRVTALTRDTDNAMLVVTPSGVTRLLGRDPEITHVKLSDGHGAPVRVTALCRQPLSGEKVWIGTASGLMTYNPADGTVQHNVVPALAGIMVTSLTADGGDLWIGTRHHGLWRYTLSTGHIRRYVYDQSMPYAVISNDINDVYRTRSGEVFVLTDWGLCKYSPAKDNFYTLPEIGSHTPFVTMREDKQGRLWAATSSDGIYRRESANQAFQAGHGRSIGKRSVSILYLDSRDTLWAAQGSRVYRFNAQTDDFEQLSVPMTRDYPVVFLQEDNEQNMWIGTFGGLVKVTPDGATSYYAFHSPSAGITLPASSAAALLPDGKIAFGAGDELCVVNPRDMKSSTQRVNAYVQGISFPYFEDSQAEVERLGLDALLYTRKEIRLPYADNTFTLHLAASRYGEMPRVRFDYQLEGVDKGWIRDAGPEATYTDLRPGTYTFRVMANFGSDAPVSEIRIVILPPWYLTTWAYVAYVLLGLLLIVGVSVLYRRRLKLNYQHHLNELRVQKEQETFESKMRFFVNLVHEIRTPLTLINIPLEQMADGLAGGIDADNLDVDKARRHISSMQRNVSYLLGITKQLLDFRKAEQDSEVKLNYRRVDVSALLREIVDRFHHPMHEAGKEITLTLPQEPVYAVIDTDKTDRVVMNLIGNAMKYSRHTVSVTLEAPVDGTFTISVADDGPGIPQAERKHIFDTYYQIGNDNVAASLGTGLGLAYAKLIAKSHGGNIRVRNAAESGGAVFVLTLPVGDESKISAHSELISREEAAPAVPAPAPGAPDDAASETPEAEDTAAGRTTLLIVDDNSELLSAMTEALGKWYGIVTATDGEDALRVLAEHPEIDIIVSDFMMPRMDGAELARRVKSDPELSYIPFIILTAKNGPDARMEGIESGADVFVEKPFSIRQLRAQIENILRTRERFHSRLISASGTLSATETAANPEEPLLNRIDAEFFDTLNGYIRENICDEEFSIEVLAKQMNMSRSSFYRKIKAITGLTPVDYLKNFRLDYSARLLADGMRVTEVAIQSGFTSSSYFAKCFKAKFGMIPKEYAANPPGGSSKRP